MSGSGASGWQRGVLAPLSMIVGEVRAMFEVPRAMIGGILGTLLVCGALIAVVLWAPNSEAAEDDGPELEFEPGTLVRLGKKPEELPEKIVVEEKVAAPPPQQQETVTEKEEPPPKKKPKPEKKKPKPDIKGKEKPDPNKQDAKEAERNQESNTPHNDLPTVDELPGDPFGDSSGWSDMLKDGDKWATAVMAELNKLKYPAFGAKAGTGVFRFKMQICTNGTVKKVIKAGASGSTGNATLDTAMMAEIERMKIPRPPARVLAKMTRSCVFLKYQFAWDASGRVR